MNRKGLFLEWVTLLIQDLSKHTTPKSYLIINIVINIRIHFHLSVVRWSFAQLITPNASL